MAINPNEVYTDPRAKAAILMGEQTPEKEQIASKIMNEGLPQAMESLNRPRQRLSPGMGRLMLKDCWNRGLGQKNLHGKKPSQSDNL